MCEESEEKEKCKKAAMPVKTRRSNLWAELFKTGMFEQSIVVGEMDAAGSRDVVLDHLVYVVVP